MRVLRRKEGGGRRNVVVQEYRVVRGRIRRRRKLWLLKVKVKVSRKEVGNMEERRRTKGGQRQLSIG